ncbi:hypothetical protein QYE76_058983 [Lolium multiflorum]|uniref:Uncharacterized protein n=1 Tax=Lolium multiflorum TaxID=4521 RepID=A0AAD8WQ67_LOLMU|nr:hypothetical protein QYE76_058983 [Lolium multiflorum]
MGHGGFLSVDLGHPFLNRTADGFLKVGTVGACKVAAEETFHCLHKGDVSRHKVENALKKMCKEGAYWGSVAGVYVGVEYGVDRIRGHRDWIHDLRWDFAEERHGGRSGDSVRDIFGIHRIESPTAAAIARSTPTTASIYTGHLHQPRGTAARVTHGTPRATQAVSPARSPSRSVFAVIAGTSPTTSPTTPISARRPRHGAYIAAVGLINRPRARLRQARPRSTRYHRRTAAAASPGRRRLWSTLLANDALRGAHIAGGVPPHRLTPAAYAAPRPWRRARGRLRRPRASMSEATIAPPLRRGSPPSAHGLRHAAGLPRLLSPRAPVAPGSPTSSGRGLADHRNARLGV